MPRHPRILFSDAFYHVYNRGVEKRPIVFDDRDRKTFLTLLSKTITRYEMKLFAYCLMDNHFHLYVQTLKSNLDQAMWHLGRHYVPYFNHRYDRVGPLFQGRYQCRLVESDRYSLTLTRYIHQNVLDIPKIRKLEDYPWSSYACYVGKFPTWSWLDTDWVMRQLDSDRSMALKLFGKFHTQQPEERELRMLKRMNKSLGNPILQR